MDTNITINQLLDSTDISKFRQIDFATLFIWFLTDLHENKDCLMSDIIRCFRDSSLSIPNQTTLRRNLRRLKDVTVGHSYKSFRLHRNALLKYRTNFAELLSPPLPPSPPPEEILREGLDVSKTPLLESIEINNAYKMGEVYITIHCLENSVRNLIRSVLNINFGKQWWEKTASSEMKRKLLVRKNREAKHKWLSSRGADELNYIDWSDLLTLIRKFPKEFEASIGTTKFTEIKLEELENLRNTIAHNGVLPDSEITRVELYFQDWCKQVS